MTTTLSTEAAPRARRQGLRHPVQLVLHHRKRVSTRAVVLSSALLFFAILFAAVGVQGMRAGQDRSIDSLDSQIRVEAERYLELRAELASQESPSRVMSMARELGMIDPGPVAPLAAPQPVPATLGEKDVSAGR